MVFTFDLYQTLALSIGALLLGTILQRKIFFFQRFCIPAPVIGGLIFAIISCVLYVSGIIEFSFDETMREVCMVFFFTCVGFQADLKNLKDRQYRQKKKKRKRSGQIPMRLLLFS